MGKRRQQEGFSGQRLYVLPPPVQERSRELPVVRQLYITDAGHYPVAPRHYVDRPAGRPEVILIYCTGGAGWCRIHRQRWEIRQGHVLFIPLDTPHTYGADEAIPWSIYWAHFRGSAVAEYLQALDVSLDHPTFYAPDQSVIGEAFEEVLAHPPLGYADDHLLGMSTSLARLLGLLRRHRRPAAAPERHNEDKVLRSIQAMQEGLAESFSLSAYARQAGLSVPHYCSLFRKFTQTSPGAYFSRLKMQQACLLMISTRASIAEIAAQLGFSDPFYFSRSFKKAIGLSPRAYRRAAVASQA